VSHDEFNFFFFRILPETRNHVLGYSTTLNGETKNYYYYYYYSRYTALITVTITIALFKLSSWFVATSLD